MRLEWFLHFASLFHQNLSSSHHISTPMTVSKTQPNDAHVSSNYLHFGDQGPSMSLLSECHARIKAGELVLVSLVEFIFLHIGSSVRYHI